MMLHINEAGMRSQDLLKIALLFFPQTYVHFFAEEHFKVNVVTQPSLFSSSPLFP